MKNKLILIASVVVVFIVSTIIFSIYQAKELARETAGLVPVTPQAIPQQPIPQEPRKLVPARPEDYGMVVFKKSQEPKTQGEWDNLMSAKIKEIKEQTPPDVLKEAKEAIKEDPRRTREKLQQIDDLIIKLKEDLIKDPDNQGIKDRINRLMVLKSIGKELP
ncbi:MAG: hypothetical protein PHT31_04720 [Candidatus Omnitrophica bacterium]|nr:hypothetical protein [Candidatus Omnitrophota bacterium]MDD5653449.1 hypothetical protein [Candidatus Omnitrophota bacterium]